MTILRKRYTTASATSFPLNARRLAAARELAANLRIVCHDDSDHGVNCQVDVCKALPFDLDRIMDSAAWQEVLASELLSRGSSFIGRLNRNFANYYGEPFRESVIWSDGYRVFLSYESSSFELARSLASELEKYQFNVFLAPKTIAPFSRWKDTLLDALHECDAFVALHSREYRNSVWCQQEIGIALGANVPVVHLCADGAPVGFDSETQALSVTGEPLPEVALRVFEHLMSVPGQLQMYANCVGPGQLIDSFCAAADMDEMEVYERLFYELPPQEMVDALDKSERLLVFLGKNEHVDYLRDVLLKLRKMGARIPWDDFIEPSDFSGFITKVMKPSGYEGEGLW